VTKPSCPLIIEFALFGAVPLSPACRLAELVEFVLGSSQAHKVAFSFEGCE